MANSRDSGSNWEYATVDAAIDSADEGYFTNPINLIRKRRDKMVFSVRDTVAGSVAVATVSLQFKPRGASGWQDYISDITIETGVRLLVDDAGGGNQWRAGVKWDDYTSGSITFGFDWR